MTRQEAHQLIDQLYDIKASMADDFAGDGALRVEPGVVMLADDAAELSVPTEPARVLPEGLKVVRTKTSGDRVHLLDLTKKTRQWVTKPEVLESLGFQLGDVVEVEEEEFLGYQMGPALYQPVK